MRKRRFGEKRGRYLKATTGQGKVAGIAADTRLGVVVAQVEKEEGEKKRKRKRKRKEKESVKESDGRGIKW